jgi:hypothetical protein
LPPLLAISRCFAGSIAAKPRLDPPLLLLAMSNLQMAFDAVKTLQMRLGSQS